MEEQQYLVLVQKLLLEGEKRITRNATTYSSFGEHLEFDLQNGYPLLTTKKISFKHIFEELMFFLRGETDTKILEKKGVNIWKGNTSREFLDSRDLDYEVGDMGAGYGFQWNHFGADYQGCGVDYTGQGINQLDECVNLIKTHPTSRRIIFSGWNPAAQPKMALPPCHLMLQFYVREGKYLDGQLYQRSADLMLGVPYNIASYALLLHLIARETNLSPGKLKMVFGDIHIYSEHLEGALDQLRRTPIKFPQLKINCLKNFREYDLEDIDIINYNSYPRIRMPMVA